MLTERLVERPPTPPGGFAQKVFKSVAIADRGYERSSSRSALACSASRENQAIVGNLTRCGWSFRHSRGPSEGNFIASGDFLGKAPPERGGNVVRASKCDKRGFAVAQIGNLTHSLNCTHKLFAACFTKRVRANMEGE